MAEILLGRLSGPSGFERPVVIKRILERYAADPLFRNMFLDEARLAAQIQHPNVVQHLELGQCDGQLYLVMEYLFGEPLSSLRRRAYARGVELPAEVAAHIVGEACAGLHAAHELVGADGVAQEVVHRDISPQNLFITYDGVVKIIDFGIAKAADRITETEAGTIKGRFDYLSPEQARAEPLDRRSDIFALGIVLHELLTGRRLFKRRTSAGSLRAVLSLEIPALSSVTSACPPALEAVCSRALGASPEDRFPTALDMRRALAQAQPTRAGQSLPEEKLAGLMTGLFPDRIEAKRALLERVRANVEVGPLPAAEVDSEVEIPELPAELPAEVPTNVADAAPSSPRGVKPAHAAAVVFALAAIGTGGGYALLREPSAAPAARATTLKESSRVAAPNVEITVTSDPPALLVVEGDERGRTPLTLTFPRSAAAITGTLAADGYEDTRIEFSLDRDRYLRIVLTPRPVVSLDVAPAPRRSPRRRRQARQPIDEGSGWEGARF